MTLLIANQVGARQRGGGKRNLIIVAAPLLLVLLFVQAARQPDNSGKSITAVAENGRRFSPAALAEARASGKPVFVYFTADWCLSCKANERSEEHTSELQSLMRISYAVFCLKKKTTRSKTNSP